MSEYPVAQSAGQTLGSISRAALFEVAELEWHGDYRKLEGLVVTTK